jgi:hypothetical protein
MAEQDSSGAGPWPIAPATASEYLIDAWLRSILTWDLLRQRGNQYLEHEKSGNPPVLVSDYEMVDDGRELTKPANYALVRIKPPAGCPAPAPTKRPFVVIDPRAGHGPGIGGFKMDSEIGIALKFGHPCYLVMFFPQPVPGQTIESVCAAEVQFLRKVNELHPKADKPFVIGNCQGGWALLMAASLAPETVGPLLLAGSPISYWAGVEGKNPMRYSGGLLGGSWMASMAGDIGHGIFDGAYLVNNFENLNPANTYWGKLYNLYAKVDTEGERFLEFEKWWGGHYLMNKEEMEWITQNLFVGNKLSSGQIESFDGKHRVDLRNIRTPIMVFAAWGDNITPPQQALNWIPDLYDNVDEIRLNEQTIVYCLHEKIGHLGIFVSAGVAQRETSELARALELVDTLPPGLYEAVIQDTTPDMPGLAYVEGRYLIQFVPRTTDDILALDDGRQDERAFEVAKRVAQINQQLYDRFGSPLFKAMSNEPTARWQRKTNPARAERWLISNANPAMAWVKWMADLVRAQCQPVAEDNPLLKAERDMSARIERSLDQVRDVRDEMSERMFQGHLRIALACGRCRHRRRQRQPTRRAFGHLGARRADASEAPGSRSPLRAGHAAGRLGAAPAVRGPRGEGRRRAALQPAAATGQEGQAGQRAVAGRDEGRDQAPGLRAGLGRGARHRRAAQAGDRLGGTPPRLPGCSHRRRRPRRAHTLPGRALPSRGQRAGPGQAGARAQVGMSAPCEIPSAKRAARRLAQ